jgi:hypothetical protein
MVWLEHHVHSLFYHYKTYDTSLKLCTYYIDYNMHVRAPAVVIVSTLYSF